MRITNLQYVHFFIKEREYIFSVASILSVELDRNVILINLKLENDKSIADLSSFFDTIAFQDIILFLGFYNKKTLEDEVVSANVNFINSLLSTGQLTLNFERKES